MWPRLDLVPPELRLSSLRDWGRVALARGYLNKTDRAVVEQAVKHLSSGEPEVFALLGKMSDTASARKLLEQITTIAGAAYVIGAHGAMTDTHYKFLTKSRAMHMRLRKPESRWNRDLTAVIDAKLGGRQSKNPFKDADRLLGDVNKEMRARGHKKGASRSTIYRRLKEKRS